MSKNPILYFFYAARHFQDTQCIGIARCWNQVLTQTGYAFTVREGRRRRLDVLCLGPDHGELP